MMMMKKTNVVLSHFLNTVSCKINPTYHNYHHHKFKLQNKSCTNAFNPYPLIKSFKTNGTKYNVRDRMDVQEGTKEQTCHTLFHSCSNITLRYCCLSETNRRDCMFLSRNPLFFFESSRICQTPQKDPI
mmetsp:Transcript_14261/g.25908  ORF Transcript_14261/g.25908 Transcript_14261/m.25908 type:complete len:129 (+) Transcript_14261:5355-5741(+)